MNAKLALLACKGSFEGPWSRPQGNEGGIKVSGMGGDDLVFVEYAIGSLSTTAVYELGEGENPFHCPDCKRYRILKETKTPGTPTTVEVLFK